MSDKFYITEAAPRDQDRERVVELCVKSQRLTDIPDPEIFAPEELEQHLYDERDTAHLLAIDQKTLAVVGHVAVRQPNPDHIDEWLRGIPRRSRKEANLLELGGLFIDPHFAFRGIGTALSAQGLENIRRTTSRRGFPVAATWADKPFARKIVTGLGGKELNTKDAVGGPVTLWTFGRK